MLTAFFTPAYEASLPEIVGEDDYVMALSYSRVAVDVEGIGGPALAGVLIAFMSVRWVFWFDALTYVVSAALVAGVRLPQARPANATSPHFLRELTFGIRVLMRNASIRRALVMSIAESLAGACAIVATVAYVKDVLHASEAAFSVTMACVGAGSAVAAVVIGRLTVEKPPGDEMHSWRHRWTTVSLVVGGVVLAASVLPGAVHPPLAVFGFLWFLNGAGQAMVAIPSSTLVAIHTTNAERGRAFGAHFAVTHFWWLGSYPLVGWLSHAIGPERTFTICGLLCALTVLAAFLAGSRHKPVLTEATS